MRNVDRERIEEGAERARERAKRFGKRVKGRYEDLEIEDKASRAKERVKEGAERLKERGGEARESLGELVEKGKESLPEIKRERSGSMLSKVFSRFSLGFGCGYVLGARAGRERYEQMKGWLDKAMGNPTVQQLAERGRDLADQAGQAVSGQVQGGASSYRPQSVREVMTPNPQTVRPSSTVAAAAKDMSQKDVGAMIVVDASNSILGILTDRDIAVRAVAEGKDVKTVKVSDVCSQDPTTLSPSDSVQDAVRLMRDKAIRRLPVVENGRPVGIVSIGDLAIERDPTSALADISSSPATK